MATGTFAGRTTRSVRNTLAAGLLLLGTSLVAACGDDDENLTASAIVAVSGGAQSGIVGTALSSPLIVKVTSSDGTALQGYTVNFSATGGGTLGSTTATTDAEGRAQTTYTLGSLVGTQTVTASVTGVSTPATFTLTATAVVTNQILVVSGNNQTAARNTQLPLPLMVKVQTSLGVGVPGVTVNWTTTAGTVSSGTAVTDANGNAQINYTLPNAAGANTITATINGTSTNIAFTATGT